MNDEEPTPKEVAKRRRKSALKKLSVPRRRTLKLSGKMITLDINRETGETTRRDF